MQLVSGNKEIKVPLDVAVCPDCKTQLTIYPDGWKEGDDGWICDSFTTSCATEPEIDDEGYDEWDNSHPSFDTPYIDWLPITNKIELWLKKNYRFDLS